MCYMYFYSQLYSVVSLVNSWIDSDLKQFKKLKLHNVRRKVVMINSFKLLFNLKLLVAGMYK